jgi:sugar lactone lactonase YvrE
MQRNPSTRTFVSSVAALLLAVAIVAAPAGVAAAAPYLYATDGSDGSGTIYAISPAGVVTPFVQLAGQQVYGLTTDAAGNLFAAAADRVYRVTPAGVVSTLASGLAANVAGVTLDPAGNVLAASDNGPIYRITPAGAVSTFASLPESLPSGLALAANGDVYVAGQSGRVMHLTSGGTVVGGVGNTNGAADAKFGSDGNLYATIFDQSRVDRITPDGTQTVFATGLQTPASLAFDPTGQMFVADLGGTVYKVSAAGVATPFATLPGAYGIVAAVPEPSVWGWMGMTAVAGLSSRGRRRQTA